ncbi:RNA-directed DNA polymerase, eukaryota [Artemisia annua]|uniref:RNA-directed DNA polymerase, eukaryota n=1 Tax=Artemisia annua TaxID=35608 RepID=A0A2U1MPB3_ARTAN|nr:RNA-directed DNA polymerase, eukaryota [Artemisia annua]
MALAKSWDTIIEKFSSRLSNWIASLLSIGGRTTLISLVLGAVGTYYFSLYPMPNLVNKKLESILSKFFLGVLNTLSRSLRFLGILLLLPKIEAVLVLGVSILLITTSFRNGVGDFSIILMPYGLGWLSLFMARTMTPQLSLATSKTKVFGIELQVLLIACIRKILFPIHPCSGLLTMGPPRNSGTTLGMICSLAASVWAFVFNWLDLLPPLFRA